MKSEDGAVTRGHSCTTLQRKRIPSGRFRARGTSFANTHMTSGPLNRRGNGKHRTRVHPILRAGKRNCTPLRRVSSWPRTERCDTRAPGARGGEATHRAPGPRPSGRGRLTLARKKVLSIVGSARWASQPPGSRARCALPWSVATVSACPERISLRPPTRAGAGRHPTLCDHDHCSPRDRFREGASTRTMHNGRPPRRETARV
jgi:hypothetical protein